MTILIILKSISIKRVDAKKFTFRLWQEKRSPFAFDSKRFTLRQWPDKDSPFLFQIYYLRLSVFLASQMWHFRVAFLFLSLQMCNCYQSSVSVANLLEIWSFFKNGNTKHPIDNFKDMSVLNLQIYLNRKESLKIYIYNPNFAILAFAYVFNIKSKTSFVF